MALDDFPTEDSEPVQRMELAEGAPLDEDLFDFPKSALAESVEAPAPAPVAKPVDAPAAKAEPAASGVDLDEGLFNFPKSEIHATTATAAPTAETTQASAGGEIDLDEDLYDFDDPEDESLDHLVSLGNDLAEILSEVSSPPTPEELKEISTGTLTEDLGLDGEDAHAVIRPAAQPAEQRAARAVGPSAGSGTAAAPAPLAAAPAHAVKQQPAWFAIASVLAANFILLFFAWSASRSLHAHLTEVREEIRQQPGKLPTTDASDTATAELSVDAAESFDATDGVDGEVDDGGEGDAEATPGERFAQLPHLPTEEELSLRVAEREIADERFGKARRRLYKLLARADGLPAETRATIEARALYLIGDTYARQAALGEGRP